MILFFNPNLLHFYQKKIARALKDMFPDVDDKTVNMALQTYQGEPESSTASESTENQMDSDIQLKVFIYFFVGFQLFSSVQT